VTGSQPDLGRRPVILPLKGTSGYAEKLTIANLNADRSEYGPIGGN